MQALDGDGDGRNDDGDAGDADDQEDAQYICGEGEGEAEKDEENGHSDEIDDERKPVFRAIDAPAKAEQQLKQIPEQQLRQVHGHPPSLGRDLTVQTNTLVRGSIISGTDP